jgi:hypothetical protein
LSTDALTFDYPFEIPSGRNGQTPDLRLQYNSRNNFNDGIWDYGWTDSLPYIQRINKDGTNQLFAENYFYSSLDGELVGKTASSFVPTIESGSFLTYSFSNNQWLVTDKSRFNQLSAITAAM